LDEAKKQEQNVSVDETRIKVDTNERRMLFGSEKIEEFGEPLAFTTISLFFFHTMNCLEKKEKS
jgi:hypothetical protein